ncbi:MAG: NfeD family protein [Candidatus Methanodesulfokora sp.]|jgi:membrane-bound serine protease (ClpP class)
MRFSALLILLFIPIILASADENRILVVNITGYISPATVEQVKAAVSEAENGYNALVLQINTFGGSADSTFSIVDILLSSKVPTIGYVYPVGGQALSAGSYILMATDYAAMAPYSTIGSAQPVVGYTPLNESKYLNAYSTKMRSYAEMHGRNGTAASLMVTKNLNFMPEEALKAKLVDAVEPSLESLLKNADGKTVKRADKLFVLRTYPASVEYMPTSPRVEVMRQLSDPVISSLLFSLGFMILLVGLMTPGWGAEVAGAIMILLAMIGMGVSVDLASLILLAISAVLFIAEVKKGLHGFGAIASTALLIIAVLLMVGSPWRPTLISSSWMLETMLKLILSIGGIGIAISIVFLKGISSIIRRKPVEWLPTGTGVALDDIAPGKEGYVRIKGELWRATSDEEIKAGEKVEVVGRREGILVVKRKQ